MALTAAVASAEIARILIRGGSLLSSVCPTATLAFNAFASEHLGQPDKLITINKVFLTLLPHFKGQFTLSWELDYGIRGEGSQVTVFKQGSNPLLFKILSNDFWVVTATDDENASTLARGDEMYTLAIAGDFGTCRFFEPTITISDDSQLEIVGMGIDAKLADDKSAYTLGEF